MCGSCSSEESQVSAGRGLSRRGLLVGGAGLVATAAAVATAGPAAATSPAGGPHPKRGMRVVTLGTQGGPPPTVERAGTSSVVVVDGKNYLVDAGRAAVTQYVRARLDFADLSAMFITHLHADHVADYFNFFLLAGNYSPEQHDALAGPIPVYGPGGAGGLPPTFGGGTSPTTSPEDPTPGLLALTDHSAKALAYSTNVFMRDSAIRETRSLADVREIVLPSGSGASSTNTAPPMAPFVIMEDDRVRVSAVLVPHGPVFPAFAYRFESDHGVITFSGDTTYSENLLRLAEGSDILVHESINIQGWNGPAALKDHLIESHVEVQKVGAVAEAAAAKHLVLSHIGDLATEVVHVPTWRRWAQQGYTGTVDIATELQAYRVR